jgi:hypothetical protein
MPGHENMADIHERVGRSEQHFHTLKWRVERLEDLPPRVNDLERTVQDLNINMEHLQVAQKETRDEMRAGFDSIKEEIKSGFQEFRASASVNQGRRWGVSWGLRAAVIALTIGGAGAGGLLWWTEQANASGSISATCADGTYSTSDGQGTCSGHGGVEMWTTPR